MNRATAVFLVLLRLAIGWHFLFEAIEKHRSLNRAPSDLNKPWTSEGYFREAQGPLGVLMRRKIGDADDTNLARLTPRPLPEGADASKTPPYTRMPEALEADWGAYFNRFCEHHELDSVTRETAAKKLQQAKDSYVLWLLGQPRYFLTTDEKTVKKTFQTADFEKTESVPERIEEYRSKVAEFRDLNRSVKLNQFGQDVDKSHRLALRAEVMSLRKEMSDDIARETSDMKRMLDTALTDEQQQRAKAKGPVPEAPADLTIYRVDRATRWLLTLVGVGLLLGLFTRLSCLGGALFLLMTILTTPALPWLPGPPMAEGNYVFVNKNVIECLALFALATTRSGKWLGLDGLIAMYNPFRKRPTNC